MPLPHPVQLSQLRVRSITAGLEDLSVLVPALDVENREVALLRPSGALTPGRVVVVPLDHLLALVRMESDHPDRAPVAPTPLHVPAFGGKTFDPEKDEVRLNRNLTAVLDVMGDGEWRTLYQLRQAVYTRHNVDSTEAGLSARLRDLRKPQHGGRTVERERVRETSGLWRYRLVP